MSKCDFCSEQGPGWCYPATDFVAIRIGAVVSSSEGGWAACDVCHALIQCGDRAALADRSAGLFVVANPESADVMDVLSEELRRIHDLFFDNRAGEAYPISAGVRP